MLSFLPGPVKGALSFLLIVINTVFWCLLLFPMAFLKFIFPVPAWRRLCGKALNAIATNWIMVNNWNLWLLTGIRWKVTGLEALRMDQWYLVVSNHQSWSDILVLQKVFNRRVPFLKFFLKQELIWVPILGLAWWALDYPFMKRYSKEFLEKHPELKGKDLATTRKACEKFRTMPVSIMNFVEGTRFTAAKHESQRSPYRRLLRPKAAGVAFVLGAMGERLSGILNVTIVYPDGARDLWQFLCGRVGEVRVKVEALPVTPEILGDYFDDEQYRERFQEWLNGLWAEKDGVFGEMLT
ncbi:MAG TPA: acyltransferase [bacterium]|nr:acyltransferase [bacterium]